MKESKLIYEILHKHISIKDFYLFKEELIKEINNFDKQNIGEHIYKILELIVFTFESLRTDCEHIWDFEKLLTQVFTIVDPFKEDQIS